MPLANIRRLINLFFMTNRSLHKHMQGAGVITSFSFLQFLTVQFMQEKGLVSMKDIAEFLSITPASATSLVGGLVKMHIIERITDQNDRRIVRLRATSHGRRIIDDTEDRAKKELKRIFSKLSNIDRNNLITILEKLSRILAAEKSARASDRTHRGSGVREKMNARDSRR